MAIDRWNNEREGLFSTLPEEFDGIQHKYLISIGLTIDMFVGNTFSDLTPVTNTEYIYIILS